MNRIFQELSSRARNVYTDRSTQIAIVFTQLAVSAIHFAVSMSGLFGLSPQEFELSSVALVLYLFSWSLLRGSILEARIVARQEQRRLELTEWWPFTITLATLAVMWWMNIGSIQTNLVAVIASIAWFVFERRRVTVTREAPLSTLLASAVATAVMAAGLTSLILTDNLSPTLLFVCLTIAWLVSAATMRMSTMRTSSIQPSALTSIVGVFEYVSERIGLLAIVSALAVVLPSATFREFEGARVLLSVSNPASIIVHQLVLFGFLSNSSMRKVSLLSPMIPLIVLGFWFATNAIVGLAIPPPGTFIAMTTLAAGQTAQMLARARLKSELLWRALAQMRAIVFVVYLALAAAITMDISPAASIAASGALIVTVSLFPLSELGSFKAKDQKE